MGEEKKEDLKKEEESNKKEDSKGSEEKKDEPKKEEAAAAAAEAPPEIVLKVDMHCEACARKVARALKGFEGVEEVSTDSKANRVVVKGKTADPAKVCERLQKKSGRKVELISPLPKPPEEEEAKPKPAAEENKEEKKEEPPTPITVILKVRMHCEACAQGLQKRVRKVKGVESVETDPSNDTVTVKGIMDPEKLVDYVKKRTGKQASIVKDEEKKEGEEKKEEEKKEGEEKKEEEKKDGEEGKGSADDDKKNDIQRNEYWPSKYYVEYHAYPPPQMFSDENPNACSVM